VYVLESVFSMRSADTLADLLGIGTVGILQNVYAAGATRHPEALGVHIRLVDIVKGPKVQEVLRAVEERYPLVGTSLVPVFFPGTMRVKDIDVDFWRDALARRKAPNEHGFCIDSLPPESNQANCGPKQDEAPVKVEEEGIAKS
jgi:hypothetical protein